MECPLGKLLISSRSLTNMATTETWLTDRDEMSNLNRGHSIDDSYQVSVVAMFVNDRDEMSNLNRGHSIDVKNPKYTFYTIKSSLKLA
jgi:hypothetical protein